MKRSIVSCLALVFLPAMTPASEPIKAATGEPAFVENFTPTRPMHRQAFEGSQAPIRKLPHGTTEAARFGILHFEKPLTYMIEPGEGGASRVYVDRNRDGDLTNDPPVAMRLAEAPFDKKKSWLVVVEEPEGDASIKLILPADASMAYVYETQMRQGLLELGDHSVKFALFGRGGVFDKPHNSVYLDNDGDGVIRPVDGVHGGYKVSEGHFFVNERRYAFEVAKDGSSITLTEVPGGMPPPSVDRDSPAVDFSFVDIDGVDGTLEDYKGKVVLLYFWGTWCGPCIETMPKLAETYHRYHPRGFEVLAIAKQSRPDDIRSLMAEHDLDWRHVLEDETYPITTLYRTRGVPDYVLIDAEGTIAHRGRSMNLERELARLLAPESAKE